MRGRAIARTLRWCAVVGLAVSAFVTLPRHARAETTIAYFPWVASGEMIDGTGPWYGLVSFQNLNGANCATKLYVSQGASWSVGAQFSVSAGGTRSISAKSMNVPSPGGPVRIEAQCP